MLLATAGAEAERSAESPRGRLKTGIGLALADYLVALADGDKVAIGVALATTVAAGQDAEDWGELDSARLNADAIRRLGRDFVLDDSLVHRCSRRRGMAPNSGRIAGLKIGTGLGPTRRIGARTDVSEV